MTGRTVGGLPSQWVSGGTVRRLDAGRVDQSKPGDVGTAVTKLFDVQFIHSLTPYTFRVTGHGTAKRKRVSYRKRKFYN